MKTVKEVYDRYRAVLPTVYDSNEITSITDLVLGDLTGYSRAKLKAFPELELSDQQQQAAEGVLNELQTGKPVQYVLGHTEFYGLEFKVNPSVLIPRPETEELVEWIVKTSKVQTGKQHQILDIGTGSGCIAIALKKNLPDANISAVDISKGALQTAQENARLNGAEINFIETDILNITQPDLLNQPYSVIVSNPPYVTFTDKQEMHTNVTDFEPHTALFVPDEAPLLFYIAIADFAASHLITGGYLFFEINESYGKQLVDILSHKMFYNIELRQDMFSKDRMIKAQKPN